ncbi:tRNA lysidine(34) synthetase TilS [Proteinivorax tanatarense]|uniref:tRNA(Ile)-lysidine synthase n=1 Tax=Proteinivorax tanatarense TaxID=1260629 RepID=A0AAU7VLL4_9FIRM
MLETTKKFLLSNNISNKNIVVAVSGGPDSVALINLLYTLKHEYNLCLHIAHLDHGLREEAVKDSLFVKNVAEKLDLPYTIEKRFVKQNGSVQDNARKERFDFLKDVCYKTSSRIVALGQHKDDQLETIMMNFFRGASLWGLGGIRSVNEYEGITLVRPLLEHTKEDIFQYLSRNNLPYITDESNKGTKYKRNKFRIEIIPYLEKQVGTHIKNVITENSKQWQREGEYFKMQSEKIFQDAQTDHHIFPVNLKASTIRKEHEALWGWVLVAALEKLLGQVQDFSSNHIHKLKELVMLQRASMLQLPNKVTAVRWGQYISLFKDENLPESLGDIKIKNENIEIPLNNKKIKISLNKAQGKAAHLINANFIKWPLFIRARKAGDYFFLKEDGGRKKVKDFMIDEKIPQIIRDIIPILVDADDNVLAILGERTNGKYKANKECNNKLYIYINEMEEQ